MADGDIEKDLAERSLSRRRFAKTVGAAALGATVGSSLIGAAPAEAQGTLTTQEVEEHLPAWLLIGTPSFWAAIAAEPNLLISGQITRSATEAIVKAPVVWPDGATGTFEGTESETMPGAIDSYTITHTIDETTHTYTQPLVTRDFTGAVINRPAITFV